MDKEIKAAKKNIMASLKGNVSFEAVSSYINKAGYTVNFYNPSEVNNLIEKYKLSDFSKTVRGFTIKAKDAKIVFIDISLSAENKLHTLLHETGHIVLGHMDRSSTVSDKRLQDMQVEAFAYAVLTYKKDYRLLYSVICLILTIALSITLGYKLCDAQSHTVPIVSTTRQSVTVTENPITVTDAELVQITPTGSKYHRPSCGYVKNKNCTALTREEAQKNYEPCRVCNP